MPHEPYLLRLADRLATGLAGFDRERQERHRAFVLSQQQPDGGFRGREGDSDLYYTTFGVRCLNLLGGVAPEQAETVAGFLRNHPFDRLGVIDLVSWLNTALMVQVAGGPDVLADAGDDWPQRVADSLERLRTPDGGYAKSPEGAAGSTYNTFLTCLTYELIGLSVPNPNALVQFVYDRQRDDGGFVEIAPMRRSGTNPTAAAVALLTLFGYLDDEIRDDVRGFLTDVVSDEGGFRANTRIPFADGLSTFTGLLTAQDLGLDGLLHPRAAENFIAGQLEFPTGGFRGAAWDEQADVEYTFYGLGTLGLLWSRGASPRR